MSEAQNYRKKLGEEISSLFGGEFKFYRSRLEFRRKTAGGSDVLILSGASKWSPYLSISFYFGRNFDRVREVEQHCRLTPAPYHIQQYSLNLRSMKGIGFGGPCTWDVDLTRPPAGIAGEIKSAIEGMAYPFFERFQNLLPARDALANGDSWCFSGKDVGWRFVFLADAVLDDLAHFRRWSACLNPFYAKQAQAMLDSYHPDGGSKG